MIRFYRHVQKELWRMREGVEAEAEVGSQVECEVKDEIDSWVKVHEKIMIYNASETLNLECFMWKDNTKFELPSHLIIIWCKVKDNKSNDVL